jgi:isoaspartyl peptidase/L-asparaginase-like protein (Ntn-hydrolase superfamily)
MSPIERTTSADGGRLSLPAIVVHGGAGNFDRVSSEADAGSILEGLDAALAAGWTVLAGGGSAFQAVVAAVASLEDGGRFNAGRGAVPTTAGTVEFDAGVMDGTTGKVGAVCAATWPANPVRLAAKVAEVGGPPDGPVLLAGAGADAFAERHGLERMTAAMLARATGETEDVDDGRGAAAPPGPAGAAPGALSGAGTVGAVAVDASGRVAAATSTGGRAGQVPGRVGDSPIPGAGVWADSTTAAVSATGAGEAFVVAGFGHRIHWEMQSGREIDAAVKQALDAVAILGGDGGGIAVGPDGSFAVGFNSRAMARGWRDSAGPVTRVFPTTA